MLKFIDTHAHLNFDVFDKDLDEVIKKAIAKGIEKIIVPSADKITSEKAFAISQQFENIFMAPGAHPLYLSGAGALFEENSSPSGFYLSDNSQRKTIFTLKELIQLLKEKKAVAIGEVGLDYFKAPSRKNAINKNMQIEILRKFFNLSLELDKPLILHIRSSAKSYDAFYDLINLTKQYKISPQAVVHCYAGDLDVTDKLMNLGFYFSFTRLIFYDQEVQESLKKIPLDRIMLETDAPFLSSNEGERNEPANLIDLAKKLAKLKNISLENLAKTTVETSERFFNLPG